MRLRILLVLAWLTPFDLPASQVLHWAMAGTLGNGYLLLLPSVVLGACLSHRAFLSPVNRLPSALLPWILGGICGVFGAVFAGLVDPMWSIQDCVLGYCVPAVVAAGIAVQPRRRTIFSALVSGWEAYLVLGLIALAYAVWQSVSSGSGWWNFTPMQRWLMWRYEMMNPGNAYAFWFGNANKATNLLVLMLFIGPMMLAVDGAPPDTRRMRTCALLSSIHVLAMGSKLGLLLLPVALLAGGYVRLTSASRLVLLAAAAVSFAAWSHPSSMGSLGEIFLGPDDDGVGGLFSTFASEGGRFDQWRSIWIEWQPDLQQLLLGFGSGYYGIASFGSADAESHNFFIDRLLAAGVMGLLAVFASFLLAWFGTRSLPGRQRLLLRLAICSLVLMCIREYSPSYLYRTSFAGVVVAMLLSLPAIKAERQDAHAGGHR